MGRGCHVPFKLHCLHERAPSEFLQDEGWGRERGSYEGNTPVKEAPVPKKEAPKTASAPSKDNLKKEVLHVEGMMCENCERHVKEALEALPFIESAKADHVKGTVDITSDGEPDRKRWKMPFPKQDIH